jgi:hypothetical protein
VDRAGIRITPAKDMILDKGKDTDVGTVAGRPAPQSVIPPIALTTKRQEMDRAKGQALDLATGQALDARIAQELNAVRVTGLAPATVAGGRAAQRRKSQAGTIRGTLPSSALSSYEFL